MSDDAEEERSRNGWHLDRRINLAHILTTLGILATVVAWGGSIERRQAILETRQQGMAEMSVRDRAAIRALHDDIRETNRKLDRLIEVMNRTPDR